MPEEQTTAEQQASQTQVPQQINIESPKRSKKVLWILIALIALVLVGVGIWLIVKKPPTESSKEPAKQATSTAKPKEKETKPERTKFAYTDKGNIWVLDVVTKKKAQVTKDGSDEIYNSQPIFFDENSFTHLKCKSEKCELWRVDFSGETFTTEQIKKFGGLIRSYDVDSKLKTLIYLAGEETLADQGSEINRLHLFKFDTQKDKVIYETEVVARGGSSDDAIGTKISPNGSKILFVNTVKQTDQEIIVILDSAGNKLATLSGKITGPVWKADSNTFIYRDIEKGVFSYTVETKKSEEISNETDWSGLSVSVDGKYCAHNKEYKAGDSGVIADSEVYLFDLVTKKATLMGDSLVYPVWVNSSFIVTSKLKKCAADNCVSPDMYTAEPLLVIINIGSGVSYQVQTNDTPSY
ncbi:MAG: hypothetical protein A2113_04060 [Candidatus Woykebacteria bacterium GWA1_44_8]|uniref:Dipeptidylpeptidase IV N-terminal domain-containing protein n=1 Tax=Candidatus Woykebacteria bacterium GWA1_44_8 TaxID=1802591 RepID=A0A1G1W217_9BACT|nr:MAG: hypothetical protein A2113_04060 [Candidatus Woykebacteria bacterium GWA1_44_8]